MTRFEHNDFEFDAIPTDDPAEGPVIADGLTTGEPVPAIATDPDAPEAVVIVQYRTRSFSGVLVPPALILAIAALLAIYHPELSRWFQPPPTTRPSARAASEATPKSSPIVLEVKALPVDPVPAAETVAEFVAPFLDFGDSTDLEPPGPADELVEAPGPGDDAPSSPFPAAEDGLASDSPFLAAANVPANPGFAAIVEPEMDPEAETQRALDAIRRESERIKAERAAAEHLRARQAEVERERDRVARDAQARQAEAARVLAEKDRDAFRQELLEALRRYGDLAGPEILRISERYHVEPGIGVEMAIARDLKGQADRLSRLQRVRVLRSHGLPDPLILGDLIHEEQLKETRRAPFSWSGPSKYRRLRRGDPRHPSISRPFPDGCADYGRPRVPDPWSREWFRTTIATVRDVPNHLPEHRHPVIKRL